METRITFLILLIFFISSSCEREIGNFCHKMGRWSGYLPIQQIGEKLLIDSVDCWLKVTDTSRWVNPVFYQIDDQSAFENLVECNCEIPEFNFRDYTLLMGYFFTIDYHGNLTKQEVKLSCKHFEQYISYRVYIDMFENDTCNCLIQYHAVIPKLPADFKPSHKIYRNRL